MSTIKLLNNEQYNLFYIEYHSYINDCRSNKTTPHLTEFFSRLKSKNIQFNNFNNKQLSNQLIAARNKFGNQIWPNFDDLSSYISPDAKSFLDKSVKSALLAVEIYNKPALEYRTEGFIVIMNIAWNSLFHAIFANDGQPFKYNIKEGTEEKYYELNKCLNLYVGPYKKEIEANILFLTKLRDLIVHRIMPDLDDMVFGECQACLFNYEELLSNYFGAHYQINNTLAYSLQFSNKLTDTQLKSKKTYDLIKYQSIVQFISNYRENLNPEIFQSIHYSFRIFMIPKVGNHLESSDLAVEFIRYDSKNSKEYETYENLLYVIRDKRLPGEYFKAGEVSKQVYVNLKDIMPKDWRFSASSHHVRCAKYFKIREGHYSGEPEKTNSKYCVYDPTFNQHIYTKEWIALLTDKLKDKNLYKAIMRTK
jgi:hypothetical protein